MMESTARSQDLHKGCDTDDGKEGCALGVTLYALIIRSARMCPRNRKDMGLSFLNNSLNLSLSSSNCQAIQSNTAVSIQSSSAVVG